MDKPLSPPSHTIFDLDVIHGFVKKCHDQGLDEQQAGLLLQTAFDNQIESCVPGFRQEIIQRVGESIS